MAYTWYGYTVRVFTLLCVQVYPFLHLLSVEIEEVVILVFCPCSCVRGECCLCVLSFLNYSMSKPYCADTDKGSCVSVCRGKQMTVLCVRLCVCLWVMCAPLHSGGAVAGVARRTQRLFEIIRQLPALLGLDSSLPLSPLVFSSLLSGLTSVEQQLQTAGSESYSDISWTAVLFWWPVCLRTEGLDLTQWTCFVSYQDNGCDCWNVWAPEWAAYTQNKQSKVKDTEHIYSICIFHAIKDISAGVYFIFWYVCTRTCASLAHVCTSLFAL